MLFHPKSIKFKKKFKGRLSQQPKLYNFSSEGSFFVISTKPCRISSKQIDVLFKGIKRKINKTNRISLKVFPDKPFTSKGLNSRMGKGKGNPTGVYYASVYSGQPLFEFSSISYSLALKLFRYIKYQTNTSVLLVSKPHINPCK